MTEPSPQTQEPHYLEFSLTLKSKARVFKVFRPKAIVQYASFTIGFKVTNKGKLPFPGGKTVQVNPSQGHSPVLTFETSPHHSYSHAGPREIPRIEPGQSWTLDPWLEDHSSNYSGTAWFICKVEANDGKPVGHSWVEKGKSAGRHSFTEIPFPILGHEEIRNRYRLYVVLVVSALSSVPAILAIANIVGNLVFPPSGNATGGNATG
jgi:hypothetical protein